jgi:hypothetical protein
VTGPERLRRRFYRGLHAGRPASRNCLMRMKMPSS